MEFSGAELIAISAVILNIIVYISRVPSKKDLKDLELRLSSEIGDLRSEMGDLRKAFTKNSFRSKAQVLMLGIQIALARFSVDFPC